MPKTRRDILLALADRFGGKQADELRAFLSKKSRYDSTIDRVLSDDQFAAEMKKLDRELPTPFWPLPAWELLDELDDRERKRKA
jgi:hypothetical protein